MQKLLEDIGWHQQQVQLTRDAIAAPGAAEAGTQDHHLSQLRETLVRYERTLAHLVELKSLRLRS